MAKVSTRGQGVIQSHAGLTNELRCPRINTRGQTEPPLDPFTETTIARPAQLPPIVSYAYKSVLGRGSELGEGGDLQKVVVGTIEQIRRNRPQGPWQKTAVLEDFAGFLESRDSDNLGGMVVSDEWVKWRLMINDELRHQGTHKDTSLTVALVAVASSDIAEFLLERSNDRNIVRWLCELSDFYSWLRSEKFIPYNPMHEVTGAVVNIREHGEDWRKALSTVR